MTDCPNDETPNHSVTLTKAFYLGRYEVTQAQWTARVGSNPSHYNSPSSSVPADQVPNRPVENVSWNDVVNDFQPGTGLRLPTEAEWEWACRAGTTTAFHGLLTQQHGFSDESQLGSIAWYWENTAVLGLQTLPVGGKAPNGFGLHDMLGNVSEWCADRYDNNFYAHSPTVDPVSEHGGLIETRPARGGAMPFTADKCRSSIRDDSTPNLTFKDGGFRVARTP
jgi:formylglycine-generating enzyme required for sulfatase activity